MPHGTTPTPGRARPQGPTALDQHEPAAAARGPVPSAEAPLPRVPITTPGRPAEPLIATAMHTQYGGLLRFMFRWLFGPIEYPSSAAERIRELAGGGTIVYVARARTSLLGLYFNHALARLGLPLARFVGGISLVLWQPIDQLWKMWRQRHLRARRLERGSEASGATALLQDIVVRGEPSFLFLRPEPHRRSRESHAYLKALVAAQRTSERPVYVVPHVLVGRSQSGVARGKLGQRIFGAGRRGGRLRELSLLLAPQHSTVRVADAIDLRTLIAAAPDADDGHLARRLSHEVHRAITEEERVIAGPILLAFDTTKRHVLRSPEVREQIAAMAKAEPGRSERQVERRAEKMLDEIAARYSVNWVRFLDLVMAWVFSRIYDGIVIDQEGLGRVLEAARKGPVILCPSHKSHVDYLVLSYILWEQGIAPPHIAAGANLSFFPLGSVFRRAGAFFLRRSFRGDDLYRAVFRAYVAELVRTGTSIEFFPEGTRSRSGKLAMPKFGILGMIVDAWRSGARSEALFVPVSIDYERIIEASSYERELLGADKKNEDIGALLRSTKVLRSRYGRVHVQFGDPLSLAQMAAAQGLPQSAGPEHADAWRRETERIGYRILYNLSQVCTVTPTTVAATALLGHRGRGLAQGAFLTICDAVIEYLDAAAARISDVVRAPETRSAALLEAVQKLVDEGVVKVDRAGRSDIEPIYRVPDEQRIQLDFHKNAVMNYFAPATIIARAIMRHGGGTASSEELQEDARFLSRLFKREFLYRVDASFATRFDDALATLAVRGILDVLDDGTVIVREPATIAHLAGLLDAFVESYWVTAQTLGDLRQFPLWDKELALRARERARRAFLEGGIRRPEAASRTLIDSALAWTLDVGVLDARSEGKRRRMQLSAEYEGHKLTELVEQIRSFL